MQAGIGQALGISEERCAEIVGAHWSQWVELVPALACVAIPQELEAWLRLAPHAVGDRVLRGLAQLAAEDGHNDTEAALVLAWVLHAGADAVIARLWDMAVDIDQHVAAFLWIEVRSFPWRTTGRVAANISRRVRKRVLVELGDQKQLDNFDRTLAATEFVEPTEITRIAPAIVEAIGETPREELESALAHARRNQVITDEEQRMLLDIVDAAHLHPVRTRANTRLLTDAGTDIVGQRWGVSGRKIRRLAKASIEALAAFYSDVA